MKRGGKASIAILSVAVSALIAATRLRAAKPSDRLVCQGRTAFPYVHLSLRKDGQLIDPINGQAVGQAVGKGCGLEGKTLFKDTSKIRYHRSRLYAAGFAPSVPTGSAIKTDAASPPVIARDARAVVFWAAVFGAAKGSRLQLTIFAPDGKPFTTREIAITRNQARRMGVYRAQAKGRTPMAVWPLSWAWQNYSLRQPRVKRLKHSRYLWISLKDDSTHPRLPSPLAACFRDRNRGRKDGRDKQIG